MRIGELAKRADVSRDTIRFYERHGLIRSKPGESETNSYRDYPEETILTLELVRDAQAAGFTIAELLLFIRHLEASADPEFDADKFLDRKIEELERTIERSNRFLETLRATRDALGHPDTVGKR